MTISSSMVGESLSMTVRRLTKYTTSASASSVLLRQKILKKCRDDIYHFLNHENGQVAIYDAVNPLAAGRRSLAREFAKHDVQVTFFFLIFLPKNKLQDRPLPNLHLKTLFIESACNDERIIEENVRNVKISSPDVSLEIFRIAGLS